MPVITLSTDIGQSDFLTGAIKGQFISAAPGCTIADITHQLSPHNYMQAAYICRNAFKYFPEDSIHVVVVNFFEKPQKNILLARYNNRFLFCPDNGIITMIFGERPAGVFSIDTGNTSQGLLHYTAIIAQCLPKLLQGEINSFAKPFTGFDEKYPMRSAAGPNWIESQIIFIDNFENVIINITKEEFEEHRKNRPFKIVLMRNSEVIDKISGNYTSVQAGEKVAWFNSAGYLEIAINKGNVAGLFGLQRYNENPAAMQNKLMYQTIRILFE